MTNIKTECRDTIIEFMKDKKYKETKQSYQTKVVFSNGDRMITVTFTPSGQDKHTVRVILENIIEDNTLVIFPPYGGGYYDFNREAILVILFEYLIKYCKETGLRRILVGRYGAFKQYRKTTMITTAWGINEIDVLEGLGFQPLDSYKKEMAEIKKNRESNQLEKFQYPSNDFLQLSVDTYQDNLWVIPLLKDYFQTRLLEHAAEDVFHREFKYSSLYYIHFYLNESRNIIYIVQENGQLYLLFNDSKFAINKQNIKGKLDGIFASIYEENKVAFILNPPTDKIIRLLNIYDIKINKEEATTAMEHLASMNLDFIELENDFVSRARGLEAFTIITLFLQSKSFVLQYKDKFVVGIYKNNSYSFFATDNNLVVVSYISEYYNELNSKTITNFTEHNKLH